MYEKRRKQILKHMDKGSFALLVVVMHQRKA